MENPDLTPEDELKAENELLKLKLEMEHGMSHTESNLPPEAENEWLNHIMNFEEQHKNAKRVSVYAFIGKPDFRMAEQLSDKEAESELERITGMMEASGVQLTPICDYPDRVIYRFITEELFKEEMDDIRIEGMMHCYTYEDFYPNHPYDLERYTREYAENIFSRKWNLEFSVTMMTDEVTLNGQQMSKEKFSEKVALFHELHQSITLQQMDVTHIDFNTEEARALVKAELEFELTLPDGTKQLHKNDCSFRYLYEWDCWCAAEITFSNFNL